MFTVFWGTPFPRIRISCGFPVLLEAVLYRRDYTHYRCSHECIHMARLEHDKRYSLDIETARVAVIGDSTSDLLSDALKKMDRLIGRYVTCTAYTLYLYTCISAACVYGLFLLVELKTADMLWCFSLVLHVQLHVCAVE